MQRKLSIRTSAFIATATVAILATACGGGKDKKVAPAQAPTAAAIGQKSSDSAPKVNGEGDCTKDSCSPATMFSDTAGQKNDSNEFLATVGEPVDWVITGNAEESNRDVKVVVLKVKPSNSDLSWDDPGSSVAINFTPTAEGGGEIMFALRDMTKCEAEKGDCGSTKLQRNFDKEESVSFQVVGANKPEGKKDVASGDEPDAPVSPATAVTVKVSDPNCGGKKATTNADIQGQALQTGLKVLTGGPNALLQLGVGVIAGGGLGGGSGSQPAPTPC